MKQLLLASAILIVPGTALAQSPTAEELTRMLNGAPPASARAEPPAGAQPASGTSAVRPAPQVAPARSTEAVKAPPSAPVIRPAQSVAPTSALAPAQTRAPAPARSNPVAPTRAPVPSTVSPRSATVPTASPSSRPPASAAASSPASVPAPIEAPATRTSAASPAPSTRSASASAALSPEAVAGLPFRIDLPAGVQVFAGQTGVDSRVWTLKRAGKTLAMIYAGPSSQFPIYDGDQVTAAGRTSVVVNEGTRRIAMEHLFQRSSAPAEIHVWLMATSGTDRDLAERVAQTLDPK